MKKVQTSRLSPGKLQPGGENTHSVMSAHRGLPSSKLFTDLDRVEIGDTFQIIVLDQVLTYQVDFIKVIEPTDISDLQIIEGGDYCTLFTCTPYGINTHRLLVRGVRIETIEENSFQDLNKEESVNVLLRDSVMKVLGQQYRRLSFMDYQLGGPYLKKRKYIIGQTIQGEEIDGIDILHYDNTIYEIKVYFKDYENGFDSLELNKILDLYREKYGNNYGGNEWVFSNSIIKIETKLEEFTIGKNGKLIRGKHRNMPQRDVITEIIITYHDYEIDPGSHIADLNVQLRMIPAKGGEPEVLV